MFEVLLIFFGAVFALLTCDISEGYSCITEAWDYLGHEKISINIVCNTNFLHSRCSSVLHTEHKQSNCSQILGLTQKLPLSLVLQSAFIGFGGNVTRQQVKERASWYVTSFGELLKELEKIWRLLFFMKKERKVLFLVLMFVFFYILAPKACAF